MSRENALDQFRKMLDLANWPAPIKDGHYFIMNGEVYAFVPSGDPLEERIYKPLFWRFE